MGDPHHYEKAARYARAAWLRKSAPGAEKLGISYPGVPGVNFAPSLAMFDVAEFSETPFTARFFWHERVDASPQHQWLRGIFAQAADNQ